MLDWSDFKALVLFQSHQQLIFLRLQRNLIVLQLAQRQHVERSASVWPGCEVCCEGRRHSHETTSSFALIFSYWPIHSQLVFLRH